MKPLLLEMSAFGPFADRQVIDFRLLGDQPFFLIHGPTGSGKTSILDAMCFALFGDSSGGERKSAQMRSHHARPQTLTEVVFEFALGERHYRVRRRPEQPRKARRGTGETLEPQQAELHQQMQEALTVVLKPLASGWTRVNEAVSALLGFESAQFRQVIILPQGKFFDFLKAGSQDREKILQTLFGTELYKRIEEQLRMTEAALHRQSDQLLAARKALLDQAKVAGIEMLAARLEQETEACAALHATELQHAQASQTADVALQAGQALHAWFAELDGAQASIEVLQSQADEVAAGRVRLERARAAAIVQPQALLHQEAVRVLEADTARAVQLQEQAFSSRTAYEAAVAAHDRTFGQSAQLEQVAHRILTLASLIGRAGLIEQAHQEHAQAKAAEHQASVMYAQSEQALLHARERHQALTAALQVQRAQVAQLGSIQAAVQSIEATLQAHEALNQALAQVATLREQEMGHRLTVQAAERCVQQAAADQHRVRLAWMAGQAARLADALHAGEPCPVCGSIEHPSPAQGIGAPSRLDDALESAQTVHEQTQDRLRAAQQALMRSEQAIDFSAQHVTALRAALPAVDAPSDETRQRLAQTRALASAALAAQSGLQTECDALDEATRALEHAQFVAQSCGEQVSLARGQLLAKAATLAARQEGAPPEGTNLRTLHTAHAEQVALRDQIQTAMKSAAAVLAAAGSDDTRISSLLQSAQAAQGRAQETVNRCVHALADSLRVHGFGDVHAYQVAIMDPGALQALDDRLRSHDAELNAAHQRMQRAVSHTRGLPRPDLTRLRSDQDAARGAHVHAVREERAAQAQLDASRASMQALQAHDAQFRQVEQRYGLVRKVSEVANGSNVQRISFQRYVLATLLEAVLLATTLRLRAMTRGRYAMRRKPAPADQRSAAGLDLEVMDEHTGVARTVQTLSGGESFMASLTLALGLSDVVQAYSGGMRLDAMFVDEGFGTLDTEALDLAFRVLKDLQQSGRMVGIISHVAELREWVQARLEIQSGVSGSTARFVI